MILQRLRRAARYAIPIFLLAWIGGGVYEVVEVIRARQPRAQVPEEVETWAGIAGVVALLFFFIRAADRVTRLPSWTFVWLQAVWTGAATVLVVHIFAYGRPGRAVVAAATASVAWTILHRVIPGFPGARVERTLEAAGETRAKADEAEKRATEAQEERAKAESRAAAAAVEAQAAVADEEAADARAERDLP